VGCSYRCATGTAGETTYGGGRYLLDTAKGADLGTSGRRLIIDLNFLYHPSCRYDSSWLCPLAPPGNTITAALEAGERMRGLGATVGSTESAWRLHRGGRG
jgi:hypothetical protein